MTDIISQISTFLSTAEEEHEIFLLFIMILKPSGEKNIINNPFV